MRCSRALLRASTTIREPAIRSALAGSALVLASCSVPSTDDPTDAPDQAAVEFICPSQDADRHDAFIDCVESFEPAPSATFGHERMPEVVLGPPQGAGALGSTDVVSLGCGGEITLYFAGEGIQDGPGDDFIVFENPFALGEGSFVEPARVLVSDDGERWREFPCDLDSQPPRGCAGIELVYATDQAEALDPEIAGGDAFDLTQVDLQQVHWIRLIDVTRGYYGHDMWCAGEAGGFDLDAIGSLHPD
ncbi:MAG TPA: cell surface protein [Nannocystis exedens]|nr:cell surface protein [Nannocystis exedens]